MMGSFVWLHLAGVALQNVVSVQKRLAVMAHHHLVPAQLLAKVHRLVRCWCLMAAHSVLEVGQRSLDL